MGSVPGETQPTQPNPFYFESGSRGPITALYGQANRRYDISGVTYYRPGDEYEPARDILL